MSDQLIGVIGGSGLYELEELSGVEERRLETPFGDPSDAYIVGDYRGVKLAFLPRHGRGHRLLPGEVNYRANIFGFKLLGASRMISLSAVGSMKEQIAPGEMVIVDQFIDLTKRRTSSFFGAGVVGHVEFADPVCATLAGVLFQAARDAGAKVHQGGTYVCIEGPQFSTRAESRVYRSWGVDVIGMTNMPEAKLAREAGICYATVAMPTDYDCWYEAAADVSVTAVLETLRENAATAQRIVVNAARLLAEGDLPACGCAVAGKNAIFSDPSAMDPQTRANLAPIIGEVSE